MKLGELKTAIRKMNGNPRVLVSVGSKPLFEVSVQKQSLLDQLTDSFEHKNTETGLGFDGLLLVSVEQQPPEPVEIDLELDGLDLGDL
jgi:hypothetical protein